MVLRLSVLPHLCRVPAQSNSGEIRGPSFRVVSFLGLERRGPGSVASRVGTRLRVAVRVQSEADG